MTVNTVDLLTSLEEALVGDDWSPEAHKKIDSLVEVLNDRDMADEEYERYSLLLKKF